MWAWLAGSAAGGGLPAVVGVKVHKDAVWLQQPVPAAVGAGQVGQCPGQVAGHQRIKAAGGKVGMHRVHHRKLRRNSQRGGGAAGLLDHGGGQVDAGDGVALGGQQHGKKAAAGAQVQNPQPALRGQIPVQRGQPLVVLFAGQFPPPLGGKRPCPAGPVSGDAVLQIGFHICILSARWGKQKPKPVRRTCRCAEQTSACKLSTKRKKKRQSPGAPPAAPGLLAGPHPLQ